MDELGTFTDTAVLILLSLAGGDKHGYAMIDDIEAITGKRLGPGTLYGALVRLEERALIEALPTDDRRKPYRITSDGRAALQSYLQHLRSLSDTGLKRLGSEA